MAKSAVLEQYSDIWLDKHNYLEAERIFFENKLNSTRNNLNISKNNTNNNNMGRKNKNKSNATANIATTSPDVSTPLITSSPNPSQPVSVSDPVPEIDKTVSEILNKQQTQTAPQNKGAPQQQQQQKSKQNKGGQQQQQPKQDKNQQQNNNSDIKKNKTPERDSNTDNPPTSNPEPIQKKVGNNKSQNNNEKMDGIAKMSLGDNSELLKKIASLEIENKSFKKDIQGLQDLIKKLETRLTGLEKSGGGAPVKPAAAPAKPAAAPAKPAPADDDDDVDLFGSDSEGESEEAKRIKEERLAAYAAKKSKKPVLIAKSNIILDVKPWDDETDMKLLEKEVRKIEMDGLLWGASKLVPLAFGIHKLQISCVVEDDKVSVDLLTETIEAIEDYVQSVDIAAFNKV